MDKTFSKSTSIQVEIFVSNSSFTCHTGGGFYSEIFGSLQILNSRFIDNSGNGARIALIDFDHNNITVIIHNSTFTNNTDNNASFGGGGLDIILSVGSYFGHIILEVKECHFVDNSAHGLRGGGFKLGVMPRCTQDSMSMSMYDTQFANNEGGHVTLELLEGSEVLITNSTFRHGYGGLGGGAIDIIVNSVENAPWLWSRIIFVKMTRATFLNNLAEDGGAIGMEFMNKITTQIYLIDCVFINNSAIRCGGAILLNMVIRQQRPLYLPSKCHQNVTIENATFSENSATYGAGVLIYLEDMLGLSLDPSYITIVIHSSQYEKNKGVPIVVYNLGRESSVDVNVYVTLSQFHSNLAINPLTGINQYDDTTGIIKVNEECEKWISTKLFIKDTEFVGNRGSCIAVRESQLTLVGKVTFTGNTAFAGAAILLDCEFNDQPSILHLHSNTTVLITNNTAWHYGGGMAVNPECYDSKQCFYRASCWNQSEVCRIW